MYNPGCNSELFVLFAPVLITVHKCFSLQCYRNEDRRHGCIRFGQFYVICEGYMKVWFQNIDINVFKNVQKSCFLVCIVLVCCFF